MKKVTGEKFPLGIYLKSHTADRLGIDNTPGDEEFKNIKKVHYNIIEPIYLTLYDKGILTKENSRSFMISSGYRCEKLNTAVRGSKNSQHMKGEAVDFEFMGYDNHLLWELCKNTLKTFDQLILENYNGDVLQSGWIHCSYTERRENRKEAFFKNCKNI